MPPLRFRDKRSPSKLEDRFIFLWQLASGAGVPIPRGTKMARGLRPSAEPHAH